MKTTLARGANVYGSSRAAQGPWVLAAYRLTADFPKRETYGLTAQLRRAAVSIPANIAEGFRRRGKPTKLVS
jgi:four helix bundle protein